MDGWEIGGCGWLGRVVRSWVVHQWMGSDGIDMKGWIGG